MLDGETPRLLDEWQRVLKLWDVLRRAVDDRGAAGQFVLTGSAIPDGTIPRHSGAGRSSLVRTRTMTLTGLRKEISRQTRSIGTRCRRNGSRS